MDLHSGVKKWISTECVSLYKNTYWFWLYLFYLNLCDCLVKSSKAYCKWLTSMTHLKSVSSTKSCLMWHQGEWNETFYKCTIKYMSKCQLTFPYPERLCLLEKLITLEHSTIQYILAVRWRIFLCHLCFLIFGFHSFLRLRLVNFIIKL